MVKRIEIIGLETIPEVREGDDLGKMIVEAASREGVRIEDGDLIIVTQKIVSKAEGRVVDLTKVKPSRKALKVARIVGKDPRLVEVILNESIKIVKLSRGHLITMSRDGSTCANSGVDKSNVNGGKRVTLLPINPDESAEAIRKRVEELTGRKIGVIISDTRGRVLRNGQIDVAIGISGVKAFKDYRGSTDPYGYVIRVKKIAVADELASAAELIIGQGGERVPVAIIKGLNLLGEGRGSELIRREEEWLFK